MPLPTDEMDETQAAREAAMLRTRSGMLGSKPSEMSPELVAKAKAGLAGAVDPFQLATGDVQQAEPMVAMVGSALTPGAMIAAPVKAIQASVKAVGPTIGTLLGVLGLTGTSTEAGPSPRAEARAKAYGEDLAAKAAKKRELEEAERTLPKPDELKSRGLAKKDWMDLTPDQRKNFTGMPKNETLIEAGLDSKSYLASHENIRNALMSAPDEAVRKRMGFGSLKDFVNAPPEAIAKARLKLVDEDATIAKAGMPFHDREPGLSDAIMKIGLGAAVALPFLTKAPNIPFIRAWRKDANEMTALTIKEEKSAAELNRMDQLKKSLSESAKTWKKENPEGFANGLKDIAKNVTAPIASGLFAAEGIAQVVPTVLDYAYKKPGTKAHDEAEKKLFDWGSEENSKFWKQIGAAFGAGAMISATGSKLANPAYSTAFRAPIEQTQGLIRRQPKGALPVSEYEKTYSGMK